jgi:NAD(P)-dependent dehydrogenase (short-subunit alcohol dehydrogenase family)
MKTIVITGGTGDLGSVVVPRLVRDYRCVVVYRTRESFEKLAAHENLIGAASLEEALQYAPLHGLVNLVGGFANGASPDDFTKQLETNLMPFVRAVHALAARIEDGGRIVAMSSVASQTKPAGLGAYVASKAALNAFIESLAKELGKRRVTVNALLPGSIDTPENRASTPAAKLVPATGIADLIAFLLSEDSRHLNGQLLGVTP